MTKGECIASHCGFKRAPGADYELQKHDGSKYTVRVYKLVNEHGAFRLECDSYYGYSKLFLNGIALGDFEWKYEKIPAVVGKNA